MLACRVMSLLDDPHMIVVAAAVDALGKLRYTDAAVVLERMVDHPD